MAVSLLQLYALFRWGNGTGLDKFGALAALLGFYGIGDILEFGRWKDVAQVQEVVDHLVDRVLYEWRDEEMAILVLHTLDLVKYHQHWDGHVWDTGDLYAILQFGSPKTKMVARRTLKMFGALPEGEE